MPASASNCRTSTPRQITLAIWREATDGSIGPFIAALRSPELARRLERLGDYVRGGSALDRRLMEMTVLLTAREWTQLLKWHVHAPLAAERGLSPGVIRAIAERRRPERMKRDEAVVHDFVAELHRRKSVSDATYARAVRVLGEAGVEVAAPSGASTCNSITECGLRKLTLAIVPVTAKSVTSRLNILKSCHNEIRNNEGLDPTAAFDEMSKVMFCKLFEEKENPQHNRFRSAVFDDSMERLKINVVDQIFQDAKANPTYSGLFHSDAQINLKDRTIRKIVGLFENYDLGLTAFDVKGEAFEYFLGDTFTGGLGEYFTPRNIVEFMVEAIDPKIGDKIIDPFCGTGGFLIYAFELVSEKIRLQDFSEAEKKKWRLDLSDRCLYGTDWKERTSQACKMNMMVHGDGSSGVFMHDGMTDIPGKIDEGAFDICLTNPPFGSWETDSDVLKRFELGAGRNSQDRVILALERCLRLVKPGGSIAIVVIDGVLNNSSTKHVRDYVKRGAWIRAVVSLNKETFEGYGARAKTSILLLERKAEPDDGAQEGVFMAIARNTGLAPNGALIPGNVLPDVLLDYCAFLRGEDTVGQHSESWTAAVEDRLDAEFYSRSFEYAETDIESLRGELEATQGKIAEANGELSAFVDVFSTLDFVSVRLGDILDEVSAKEQLAPETMYRLVGVRWWGEARSSGRKSSGARSRRSLPIECSPTL